MEKITGLDALNKKTDNLTIAFIGGSITEGTNRATPGCFYVDIVGQYFRRYFNTQKVSIINAGWGGTGSEFGLFRLFDDVIQHNPDLVFIEFAANDILKDSFHIKLYMENIVKNLCSLSKPPVINFIYTTDNEYKATIKEHEEIAQHYSIPSINILNHIKTLIENKEISFDKIFGDSIHPNNYGYQIYADFIIETIFSNIDNFFVLPDADKPRLISRAIKNPSIVPVNDQMLNGSWQRRPQVNKHLCAAAESAKPGDKLVFEFNGDYLGILCEDMYTKGEAFCTLDGKKLGKIAPIAYSPALICDDLNAGHHTLVLEAASDTPFRIAGFMINNI